MRQAIRTNNYCAIYIYGIRTIPYVSFDVVRDASITKVCDLYAIHSVIMRTAVRYRNNIIRVLSSYAKYVIFLRLERYIGRFANAIIVLSDLDKHLLMARPRNIKQNKIFVVHPWVKTRLLGDSIGNLNKDKTICALGSLFYISNAQGLRWFYREVFNEQLRADGWHMLVIGDYNKHACLHIERDPAVTIYGYMPTLDFLSQLRPLAGIVPIFSGTGVRFKILDFFNMGIPVVTTRIGAEGLIVRDGEEVIFADTPAEFARALLRLYGDKGLQATLIENGRRYLNQHCTFDGAKAQMLAVFQGLRGAPTVIHE